MLPGVAAAAALGLSCTSTEPPAKKEDASSRSSVVDEDGPATPSAAGADDAKAAPEAVRAAMEAYRAAILASEGARAVELVTANTVEKFGELRVAALTEDREAIKQRSLMEELIVLLIRHRVPTAKLQAMDAKAMLLHAYDEGWVGKESVKDIALGEVKISGEAASIALVDGAGRPTPLHFELRREQGVWKLDVTSMMAQTQGTMKQALAQVDPDPDAAILKLLTMMTGRDYDASAWDPPRPAAK